MTARKYADVIKAWADGARVQYEVDSRNGIVWMDYPDDCSCPPNILDGDTWRIKPELPRYRVALALDKDRYRWYTYTINSNGCEPPCHNFVKWLTDWIEYEASNN